MLTDADFGQGMRRLSDFYDKKPMPTDGMELWYQKLKWVDRRDFQVAIDDITTCERSFPTPQVVLKYAADARQRRAANEAFREKEEAIAFFNPEKHTPGIAQDSVRLLEALNKLDPGSIEKAEFEVTAYKAMMKKYPTAGWEENYRDAVKKLNGMLRGEGQSNAVNF